MNQKGKAINRKVGIEEMELNKKNFYSTNNTQSKGIVARIKAFLSPKTPQSGLWRGVKSGFKNAALVGLLGFSLNSFASGLKHFNYVLPAKDYGTKIVVVNNDLFFFSDGEYAVRYSAYDADGNLLGETNDYLYKNEKKEFFLEDLFPNIDSSKIGLVKVAGTNKNDVWVVYSSPDGAQNAMLQAPDDASSEVYNIHFTNNDYWRFITNLAKIDNNGNSVKVVVFPSLEEILLDGGVNAYGFQTPDLSSKVGSVSFDIKNFFGGVVPDDASWFKVVSENVDSNPFGNTVTPVNNLVINSLFMKRDGTSGGAFSKSVPFRELYVPHIAADGDYWWTGLVLNNPHEFPVNFFAEFYDDGGHLLDSDPDKEGVNPFYGVIPAYGKFVDLINNFGMPEGAAFARIVADAPIMGGELFGGEPNGKNWPIMAGVSLLPPGTMGYLASVSDVSNPPLFSYSIPIAKSKDPDASSNGEWTGFAFLNVSQEDQNVVVELYDKTQVIGSLDVLVDALSKKAVLLKTLLEDAGLSDLRDRVDHVKIYGSRALSSSVNNREVMVYALYGDLGVNGEHTKLVGEDATNTSYLKVNFFIGNETVGLEGLENLINYYEGFSGEDKDIIKAQVIIEARDHAYTEIDGYKIFLFDSDGNKVGFLGGGGPASSDKPYYLNSESIIQVDSIVGPYGTYHIGLDVYVSINNIETTFEYRSSTRQFTHNPEQDLLITNAYDILSDDEARQRLAKILGRSDVTYGENHTPMTYQKVYDYLVKLTNGDDYTDDEMESSNGAELAKTNNKFLINIYNSLGVHATRFFDLPDEKVEREVEDFFKSYNAQFVIDNN